MDIILRWIDGIPEIGAWSFHVESGRLADGDELRQSVVATALAATVLDRAGLLHPQTLRCHSWLRLQNDFPVAESMLPELVMEDQIPLQVEEIETVVRQFLVSHGIQDAFPRTVVVLGPGEVANLTGDTNSLDRMFDLEVLYDGVGVTVSLATYTDIWMPFDLSARPQQEIAEANAPRLASALRKLGAALQTEVDPAEPTKFAEPVDYGLSNHRDVDGEIISAVDW